MLNHGGNLNAAAKRYGISVNHWLDLSTGINPQTWPVPEIPVSVYNRLPQDDDSLHASAKAYYGCESILAIPGSQSVIQLLPELKSLSRVAVPVMGYAEHAYAWVNAGHQVDYVSVAQLEKNIHQYDVIVVINPNNPSGEMIKPERLLSWHKRLQKKSGWLIVDEAFIDTHPENSVAAYASKQGLIVLRSMGKFFGLAGIRSGFVIAEEKLLNDIKKQLGPWCVSGPSRFISLRALQDKIWQRANTQQLIASSMRLKNIIETFSVAQESASAVKGTDLFQTLFCENADLIHHKLAKNAVYTRLLDAKNGIRFGLPDEPGYSRLEKILGNIKIK